jgi:putative Ca2+/H+ antiporter (TMEM165/GDT1 family)
MWVEVFVTAFVLQLLALPGEKGQLVIAGLATVHNPYVVAGGAATAFGGWTILEILLGNALKGALPVVYLDAAAAGLFVLFAIWILYDGATTDEATTSDTSSSKTVLRETSSSREGDISDDSLTASNLEGYFSSFSAMAVAEFGDKTQLITISLAATYGANPAIWLGEMAAIVPISTLTAVTFARTTHYLNLVWIRRGAAGMFLLFAANIASEYLLGVSFLPF